jgi:alpha(1,3/1,4) fucosyltransferase
MEKVVIFDSGISDGGNNKIFNADLAKTISHTLLPLCYVVEAAQKEGITFITPDIFLKNPKRWDGTQVLLISHLVYPHTKDLIALGAQPLLLTCQESPFIATRFYAHVKRYSSMFRYSMLFPGMQKQVSRKTQFFPMFFPMYFTGIPRAQIPFADKKFITYIASNKETNSLIKRIIIKSLYGLSVQLIYPFRRKIIQFLSNRNDFDLYGRGWESDTSPYIKKVYRKEAIDDKEKKLQEYKFVLCLENAVFPGYITEKIFDCFFAGAVPVYMGAPDIDAYIPKNTFINIRDFKDLESLVAFLEALDETAYTAYLQNINGFLQSESFVKWSHIRFSKVIIDLIKSA